jgi:hypothetical protein
MNDVLNHDTLVMSRAGHDGDNQPHAVLSVWLGDYFGRLCDSIVTVCTPAKRRSGNRNATPTREFVGPVGLEPTIRITYLAWQCKSRPVITSRSSFIFKGKRRPHGALA